MWSEVWSVALTSNGGIHCTDTSRSTLLYLLQDEKLNLISQPGKKENSIVDFYIVVTVLLCMKTTEW